MTLQSPSPVTSPGSPNALASIAAGWIGAWTNHRQVEANLRRGGPAAPELSRERRQMRVVRLEAPQLGEWVLFFEEMRASVPGLAHRQRVMLLELDAAEGCEPVPVARQLFFREGPAYDRPPLDPALVARMARHDFRREPGCDLLFQWEEALQRWRGGMRPCACRYQHPESGLVYADFTMLLLPDQLWYRDRSLHLPDHTIRGEVDGFSWLLFDRVDRVDGSALQADEEATQAAASDALPSGWWSGVSDGGASTPAGQGLATAPASAAPKGVADWLRPGVYEGSFRRYDATGALIETLASVVVIRLLEEADGLHYSQTNLYRFADGSQQRIDTRGSVENGRIHFRNPRLEGWCQPLEWGGETGDGGGSDGSGDSDGEEEGRSLQLLIRYRDGSGRRLLEQIVISADGLQRARVAQVLQNGQLAGRTLIDERLVSSDWRAWDRDHPASGG